MAFAIQELIQIYGVTNDDPGSSGSDGSRLWQRFSDEVHEIMAPLMHSRSVQSSHFPPFCLFRIRAKMFAACKFEIA